MKPDPHKRPTLADVARLAGVSLGSASRALSVPSEVKPRTLESVQKAVEKLGYIRHGAARALASQRTHTIAAIYPTLNNPIFAHSTHSIQQTLWDLGYQLLIASHEYHFDDEEAVIRATVETGIDGIIMVGTDHEPGVFQLLKNRNLPYVLTWSTDDSDYPHCMGISNFDASYRLAQLVLEKGHRKIAICGGAIQKNERARGRRAGIVVALHEKGLDVPPEWIIEQPFSYEGGRQAMKLLWQQKKKPTAVMFGTDLQAMGALHACRQMGIRVPDDVSIIGFDGIDEAAMMQPSLTTICIPAHEIGIRAARRIVELVEQRPITSFPPLEPLLADRESVSLLRKPRARRA